MALVSGAMPAEPGAVEIRPLREEDIDAVVAIEREAFTTPWQPDTFLGLLERQGVELLVLVDAGEGIIGYAVLWCILDQGELANIAVTPGRRGQGLGARLLRHVMDVARQRGVEKLFLEVRASNAPALAMYAAFGFDQVGRRRAYYDHPKEDALVMRATLS